MKKYIYVLLAVIILGVIGVGCIGGSEVENKDMADWELIGSGNLVSFSSGAITVGNDAIAFGYDPFMYFISKSIDKQCKATTKISLKIGQFYYVYKLRTCIIITEQPKDEIVDCEIVWSK
jgi:hypothetical protein